MRRLALVGVCLAVLAWPSAALASTVSKSGATITYAGQVGEGNDVTVVVSGSNFVFTEAADGTPVTIQNGGGCLSFGSNTANCATTDVSRIVFNLNDQNDTANASTITIAVTLNGQAGADTLTGGSGSDTLDGGTENDILNGGAGNDTFASSAGNDTVTGGAGDDLFSMGSAADGTDTFTGGTGVDTADYSLRSANLTLTVDDVANDGAAGENDNLRNASTTDTIETVKGGSGTDSITGSACPNTLMGGGGNDTLNGAAGGLCGLKLGSTSDDDVLDGGAGDDVLNGLAGSDLLRGGAGADQFNGGSNPVTGGDTADYSDHSGGLSYTAISLDNVANDGGSGLFDLTSAEGDNVHDDIEIVSGSPGNDRITGSADAETLNGNGGYDFLRGGAGADTLNGGADNDRLEGDAGADVMNGGDGFDVASYYLRSAAITASLDGVANDGAAGEGDLIGTDVEALLGGNGSDNLTGNNGPNVLVGSGGSDTLNGLGGNDSLAGGSGHIFGGTENGAFFQAVLTYPIPTQDPSSDSGDDLVAGDGNDTLYGENGGDILDGLAGDDLLLGDSGGDTLNGGAGDDDLLGGTGGDSLNGNGGIDTADYGDRTCYINNCDPPPARVTVTIDGSANDGESGEHDNVKTDVENIVGGWGSDTLTGSDAPNSIVGNAGNDVINGLGGNDTLNGTGLGSSFLEDDDTLNGGAGNDSLSDDKGADTLAGGDGNDSLSGGSGGDSLNGDAGVDTVSYAGRSGAVTVEFLTAANDGESGEGDTVFSTNETIIGGNGNDTLNATTTAVVKLGPSPGHTIDGGPGSDTLISGPGSDTIIGGPGVDTASYAARTAAVIVNLLVAGGDGGRLEGDDVASDVENVTGGSGNDSLTGSDSNNVLIGGGGVDTLNGAGGSDTLDGGAGADALLGGDGSDTADYSSRSAPITADLLGTAGDGEAGENDTIGSDVEAVKGGSGADLFLGGPAADGPDRFTGGAGLDTMDYSARTQGVKAHKGFGMDGEAGEGDTVDNDVENVKGGSGNDELIAALTGSVLLGGSGNDILTGGSGDDVVDGGPGGDTMTGGAASDILDYSARTAPVFVTLGDGLANDGEAGEGDNAGPDFDVVKGGSGNDRLIGSGIQNILRGEGGDDFLDGAGANDTLLGGPGNDRLLGGPGGAGTDNDDLVGEAGVDTADYSARTQPLVIDADDDDDDGGPGEGDNVWMSTENILGGSGNDSLTGSASDNMLNGNGGTDTYYGLAGNDTILSRDGNAENADCGDGASDVIEADMSEGTVTNCETTNARAFQPPVSTPPVPAPTGDARLGATLTAQNGTWTGFAPIGFAYQWQSCDVSLSSCSPIAGATGQTYDAKVADVGRRLEVVVTASNEDGDASATSEATDEIVMTRADLALTTSESRDPAELRGLLTYTLIVTNNGPDGATGIVVSDDLPAALTFVSASAGCTGPDPVVCDVADLASSGSAQVTITVRTKAAGALHNEASVSATQLDESLDDNTAFVDTTVSTCTRIGTPGNDRLVGTAGADVLCGFGGNDTLIGKGGADVLLGGTGNDVLDGGGGKDVLNGDGGKDKLLARDGTRDIVNGGTGSDSAKVDRIDRRFSIEKLL